MHFGGDALALLQGNLHFLLLENLRLGALLLRHIVQKQQAAHFQPAEIGQQ